MKDSYKIIIWAKPQEESLEEQVNCTFRILDTFRRYRFCDTLLLPANSKKEVRAFDLEEKNIVKHILSKRDKIFPDLGSLLSFFTSLNEDEAMGIIFTVGLYNCKFNNTMTVSLPDNFAPLKIIGLFKDLCEIYKAFYGCITSNFNLKLYDKWYDADRRMPKVVFWENYWGKEIVDKIQIDNEMLKGIYKYEITENGYYIRLQEEPLDMLQNEDIENQKRANSLFKL